MWPEVEDNEPDDADPFGPHAPTFESVGMDEVRAAALWAAEQTAMVRAANRNQRTSKPIASNKLTNKLFDDS